MSTVQNTAQPRHRIGIGALALGTLIAIGVALLILVPGPRTAAPARGSVPQPLAHAAAPSATDASMGYFRDSVTHKLPNKPARRKRGQQRPSHPPSGGVAP